MRLLRVVLPIGLLCLTTEAVLAGEIGCPSRSLLAEVFRAINMGDAPGLNAFTNYRCRLIEPNNVALRADDGGVVDRITTRDGAVYYVVKPNELKRR